jgi:hypothetical protein
MRNGSKMSLSIVLRVLILLVRLPFLGLRNDVAMIRDALIAASKA